MITLLHIFDFLHLNLIRTDHFCFRSLKQLLSHYITPGVGIDLALKDRNFCFLFPGKVDDNSMALVR